jgi:NAD(P)-dependent dehydrogenase (short-subunit alcohol dehydrogenase family)
MGRLDGKAAIITGGEGSIGLAVARALVAEGGSVFLAGLSERALKAAAAELNRIAPAGPGERGGYWYRRAHRRLPRGRL